MQQRPSEIKCEDPHVFLTSVIYSLSYSATQTAISGQPASFIELGYIFTSLDVPAVTNIPAPDLLLVNKVKKIVLAVDCKTGIVEPENLEKKFSEDTDNIIRQLLSDNRQEYVIEHGVFTFEDCCRDFEKITKKIYETTGKKFFIWYTSRRGQILSDEAIEVFPVKKYASSTYNYVHVDEDLDKIISRGLSIKEDRIRCNPLLDPHPKYRLVFLELAMYLIQISLKMIDQEKEIVIYRLTKMIKSDYQSPIQHATLRKILIDVVMVFNEIAELKANNTIIVFKKKPKYNSVLEKYYKIFKEMPKDCGKARQYIKDLINKRKNRT